MKVLVIGYGSMGRRRIRLLLELYADADIVCVDSSFERRRCAENAGWRVYGGLGQALAEKYDIAFVCTSPGRHAEIILRLIDAGIHVFTELNLTDDQYQQIHKRSNEKNVKVFMSGTLLYNRQIEKIEEIIKSSEGTLTYIYHVGQYLPDWHPWESYKDFFVGKKETNGVKELLAVQLPWIINAFGRVESLHVLSRRCSRLDIDFDDSVILNICHESGSAGVFVADVVSRKAVISLEVIGENVHLFWNGYNNGLLIYDMETKGLKQVSAYESTEHREGYAENIIEDQYKDELKAFLNWVHGGEMPRYSLEQDAYIISLIREIERNSSWKYCLSE